MVGAGTCLVRPHEDLAGEPGERLLAILSAANRSEAGRDVLAHVEAACRH